MSRTVRLLAFGVSALGLAALIAGGLAGLPAFGSTPTSLARYLSDSLVDLRHVTEVVTGTVFDVRALDTLGEELTLFTAAVGAALILRIQSDEDEGDIDEATLGFLPLTSPIRTVGRGLSAPLATYAIWIVVHGHLSPGGGFQGGLVLGLVPLLLYVSADLEPGSHLAGSEVPEIADAVGAGAYVAIGASALTAGAVFLANVLPLGSTGSVLSGGTILAIGVAVGLEAAGAATVVWREFVHQMLVVRTRGANR